jgi:hypothetical protein
VSRPAETNPLVKLGFQLLGRHKQVEFGRRACSRMALLTESNVRRPPGAPLGTILDGRLLSIYLRDHHTLLSALVELAHRMDVSGRAEEERTFAADLSRAAGDDRACVEAFLTRLDSAPSRVRERGVWAAVQLGRLKLNGRIVRRSPLSAVTELEGCRLLLESNRALWSGLEQLGLGPDDAAERARRAADLLDTAERLRLDALHRATRQDIGGDGAIRDGRAPD